MSSRGAVRSALRSLLEERRGELYRDAVCKMILLSLGGSSPNVHRIGHAPLTL